MASHTHLESNREQFRRLKESIASRAPFDRQDAVDELWQLSVNLQSRNPLRQQIRQIIREKLSDKHQLVRMRAVEALGQIGQRSDLQQLARMRSGEHWVVRASIYSAIAKLGRPLDLPLLQQGLTDRNPVVQRYAIVAIYDLIGCESVTILKPPFEKNKNAATRPAYINVFAKCGDTQALAELKKMAHSDDMRIAGYAQEALSGMFAEWNVC